MAMTATTRSFAELNGGIEPQSFIYEDEQCVVIEENVNKQAPVHFIVAPKKVIPRLMDASLDDEKLLGHMLLVAKKVALDLGLGTSGYHVVLDENYKTQKLKSLHVFGRALHHMVWPVGPGCRL